MSAVKNVIGEKFGRWTVISRAENTPDNRTQWLCRCECGTEKIVKMKDLRLGRSKSCGCLRKENTSNMFKKHGMTNTRLFRIWVSMKTRCYNLNAIRYADWGGRGIKICDEWKDNFLTFYDWAMSSGYQDNLTIDRIDNDGDYTPDNCRWTTPKEQNQNRRKRK